jgi:hypothetical protein
MARIDDYINARKIAVQKLVRRPLKEISEFAKLPVGDQDQLIVPFLNKVYEIHYPDFTFSDQRSPDEEVPIQEQVLLLHYLQGCKTETVTGNWIAYREIPGASFYFAAFVKRAIDPLKKVFGNNIEGLNRAGAKIGAEQMEFGDAGLQLTVLPKTPLQLILWQGDDEFPAEANILFDEIIGDILSPEDAAWLAGMVVYRMIALSH